MGIRYFRNVNVCVLKKSQIKKHFEEQNDSIRNQK